MNNDRYNASHCLDLTAYQAIENIEAERRKVGKIIKTILNILELSGYELDGRIAIKNKSSGKVWRSYMKPLISENTESVFNPKKKSDEVEHPSHYNAGKIEVIDYIEDQDLNFNLGNVVKYVSRAGKKDADKTIVDLMKAKFYIEREIKRQEARVND